MVQIKNTFLNPKLILRFTFCVVITIKFDISKPRRISSNKNWFYISKFFKLIFKVTFSILQNKESQIALHHRAYQGGWYSVGWVAYNVRPKVSIEMRKLILKFKSQVKWEFQLGAWPWDAWPLELLDRTYAFDGHLRRAFYTTYIWKSFPFIKRLCTKLPNINFTHYSKFYI